ELRVVSLRHRRFWYAIVWSDLATDDEEGGRDQNPKSEIRRPKEIKNPKPEGSKHGNRAGTRGTLPSEGFYEIRISKLHKHPLLAYGDGWVRGPCFDEYVHLLANKERQGLILHSVNHLKHTGIHTFGAVAGE